MDVDNLLTNRDMWDFQLKLSTVYKDTQKHGFRNTGDRLLVYGNPTLVKQSRHYYYYKHEIQTTAFFCRGLNTIKFALDRFRESRFPENQVDKLFSSLFNVLFR